MSTIRKGLSIFQNPQDDGEEEHASSNRTTKVYVRLMFLRIGEIDTLNEKYQAHAAIEARWPVNFGTLAATLSAEDRQRLTDGKSVSLLRYAEAHWHPQLYIENALGDLKQQLTYTAKRARKDNRIYVCEHRDIKGAFWEKLELQHFPCDVQDLSISVASMFYDDRVVLLPDPCHISGVNREAFVDQQEWKLYVHVDTQQRYVTEFLRRDSDDEEEEEREQVDNVNSRADRKRCILTVTCHAARRSNYFYWNGYCLILLITSISFCIFAIPAHLAANRIQTSCTLLLTSITFRWTVNRSLPTISYLTTMDKYAILCIFTLVVLCIWHAFLGSLVFMLTPDIRVTRDSWLVHVDQCVFMGAISIFIVLHFILLTWLYCVPLKCRRQMAKNDVNYQQSIRDDGKNTAYTPIAM